MALATATADGVPSVRFVLLKGIDERGVEFFTNYESRKGRELTENPRAALAMLWKPLQRQVRLEGPVERPDAPRSPTRTSRPAPAARSSAPGRRARAEAIPDREWLETRLREMDARYPGRASRARRTGAGSGCVPEAIEFWEGRPNRLHDREVFTRRRRRLALRCGCRRSHEAGQDAGAAGELQRARLLPQISAARITEPIGWMRQRHRGRAPPAAAAARP